MGSSLDALNAPSSLTQRRQAAATLPAFELPAPPSFPTLSGQKYPPFSHALHHSSSAAVSVGNLLTPPSNSASDSSAASSAMHTGSTPNSGAPVLPYTPTFFNQVSTPGYHTGLTPQGWQPNPLVQRSMFSPPGPLQPLYRPSSGSPTAGSLPPPPYDLSSISAYGMPNGYASPTGASLASQPQILSNPMIPRPPSEQSAHASMAEVVPSKPASAPPLYTNVPPPTTHSYSYTNGTPVSHSPHSAHGQATRSPPMHQNGMPSDGFIRPPYPSYSLPAMPGPAMSNLHSPGAQMSMVGHPGSMLPMSFNSGYSANPHGMYGPPKTQSPQQATNDRPFRCDSCPQSFHRNHDLKRHKRIHLAVKPFPCNNCDKSFSRKDALKRHRLVKGCGSKGDANRDDGVKSESGSDGVDDSPVVTVNP